MFVPLRLILGGFPVDIVRYTNLLTCLPLANSANVQLGRTVRQQQKLH